MSVFTSKRLFYDKYHDEIMNDDEICLELECMVNLLTEIYNFD